MLASNSWKPIHSGARLTIKVPMPCHPFSKGNINTWHRRLGHARVETLRKLGFHGELDDCHICPQGKLKHSKFSRGTSYAQQLLERIHSDVMGPFIEGYWGEKYCLLFIDEMSKKAFIKTLIPRSEVAAATLELIKKEQRRTQASLVYLRNDGVKDNKTKELQDFLRQEGISHEITARYCPQSNGLAERLNLTIMDKVRCMLIDANLTPKLWPYAAYYAVLIYNNLPHSALDNNKSPNDAYGDSSDFSKLYVFGSICYALRQYFSKLRRNSLLPSIFEFFSNPFQRLNEIHSQSCRFELHGPYSHHIILIFSPYFMPNPSKHDASQRVAIYIYKKWETKSNELNFKPKLLY